MSHTFFHDVTEAGVNLDPAIASTILLKLASGSRVELKLFGLDDADRAALKRVLPEVGDRAGDISIPIHHDGSLGGFAVRKTADKLRIDSADGNYVCFMKGASR